MKRWPPLVRRVLFSLLAILLFGIAFIVHRTAEREQAKNELRKLGVQAGRESLLSAVRADWRRVFKRDWWDWQDRIRIMSCAAANLDAYGPALHRLQPREVLLGFSNNLKDVSALRGLPDLRRLDFYECPAVANVEIVSEFPNLRELTFNHSPALRSLSIIKSGTKLKSLHITNCRQLEDIDALRELTSIRSLFLSRCPLIKNTESFRGLTDLEELDLSDCDQLANVEGLHQLKSLKSVNVRGCRLLTEDSIEKLLLALPKTKIRYR